LQLLRPRKLDFAKLKHYEKGALLLFPSEVGIIIRERGGGAAVRPCSSSGVHNLNIGNSVKTEK